MIAANAIRELISYVRSVNRSKGHLVQIGIDRDPCYWQREEWVAGLLELADDAEASLPSASPDDDLVTYVILQRVGMMPQRKGPYTAGKDRKHIEQMLRELYALYPDCICIVANDVPRHTDFQHGYEFLDMHGDRRKKHPRALAETAATCKPDLQVEPQEDLAARILVLRKNPTQPSLAERIHNEAIGAAAALASSAPSVAGTSADAVEPGQKWKLHCEYLPFHPSASHVEPAYRDGWNDCYRASPASAAQDAEPVAWRYDCPDGRYVYLQNAEAAHMMSKRGDVAPLYLHPPAPTGADLAARIRALPRPIGARTGDWNLALEAAARLVSPADRGKEGK